MPCLLFCWTCVLGEFFSYFKSISSLLTLGSFADPLWTTVPNKTGSWGYSLSQLLCFLSLPASCCPNLSSWTSPDISHPKTWALLLAPFYHEMVELGILPGGSKAVSRTFGWTTKKCLCPFVQWSCSSHVVVGVGLCSQKVLSYWLYG